MRHSIRLAAAATAAALAVLAAGPAEARCTRLAFSVNDYGKEGPIKDAKGLLDKYVAKWAADRGIKTFTIGKKEVSCELFLDFIVFDEHTCKASATVCWPDGQGPKTWEIEKAEGDPAPAKKPPTASARPKAAAAKSAAATPAPGAVQPSAAAAPAPQPAVAAPAAPTAATAPKAKE